jgi:hypothetical protein
LQLVGQDGLMGLEEGIPLGVSELGLSGVENLDRLPVQTVPIAMNAGAQDALEPLVLHVQTTFVITDNDTLVTEHCFSPCSGFMG